MKARFKKRALVKCKNGRHRIATAGELMLSGEVTEVRSRFHQIKHRTHQLEDRIESFLAGGLTQALPPPVRGMMLDNMTAALTEAFGKEITQQILPHVRQAPKHGGLALEGSISRGFGLVPNTEVILKAYISGFNVAVAHGVERHRR